MPGQKEEALPPWGLALAGSAGALVANAMVYPLDIVKTRLQVQSKKNAHAAKVDPSSHPHYDSTLHAIAKIIEDDGIAGLYSGITPSLIGVVSQNFAYFYWYSVVRTIYLKSRALSQPPSTPAELSLGAVAGALAQVFTIPIAVVTTRQQLQGKHEEKKSVRQTAQEIVDSEDGWTGLWRGMKASLVLVVNPSITYGAYQRLKEILFPRRTNLAPWEAFILGALSKALATVVTQPLIVAKVRLQSKPPPERNGVPFKTFNEVLAHTVKHEGWLSLFKGIGPQLMKGVAVQGILMMTKEKVELLFMLLFAYMRRLKEERLRKAAQAMAEKAKQAAPVMMK